MKELDEKNGTLRQHVRDFSSFLILTFNDCPLYDFKHEILMLYIEGLILPEVLHLHVAHFISLNKRYCR